jgi:hypothetical protein
MLHRRRKNDGPFESWNLEVLAHGLSRASPILEIAHSFCHFGMLSTPPPHHLHNIPLYFVLDISVCCSLRPASDM